MNRIAQAINRLESIGSLCESGCEGRCRSCPADDVSFALEVLREQQAPPVTNGGRSDALLSVHLAFAKLELLELQAERRTLTECPGIENVAKAIDAAKGLATREELLSLVRGALAFRRTGAQLSDKWEQAATRAVGNST